MDKATHFKFVMQIEYNNTGDIEKLAAFDMY